MALRHIFYLNRRDFNVIIGEVRWEHSDEDSSPLRFPHMNNSTKQHKMSLSELELSDCATMGFKWLHFVLPEYEKNCDSINVSWISSLISKLPHAPHFQNCYLLHHNCVDDVKIHICMWDAFMPVYSVFEAFTALPLWCTGLECNQRGKQTSYVSAKKKKKKVGGEGGK